MPSEYDKIRKFYKSDRWKIARSIRIAAASGLCEKCGAIGTEVHHKVHLTPENVDDSNVSINQDNLILLCKECHNKEHERFTDTKVYRFDSDGNMVKK